MVLRGTSDLFDLSEGEAARALSNDGGFISWAARKLLHGGPVFAWAEILDVAFRFDRSPDVVVEALRSRYGVQVSRHGAWVMVGHGLSLGGAL